MNDLLIRQAEVITQAKEELADLYVEDGQVHFAEQKIPKNYQPQQIIEASGCYVTPGLFDLQVNGFPGCNLWADPSASQFKELCQMLLKAGVTAFLPTLITDDLTHLQKN